VITIVDVGMDTAMDDINAEIKIVRDIAQSVARDVLPAEYVAIDSPFVFMTKDDEGNPAWDITFTLTSESSAAKLPTNSTLNTLVRIRDQLLARDDQRFPFIHYATADEQVTLNSDES
jgi:hypothetical protein